MSDLAALLPLAVPEHVEPGFVSGIEFAATSARILAAKCGGSVLGDRDRSTYKRFADVLGIAFDVASKRVHAGGEPDGEGEVEGV